MGKRVKNFLLVVFGILLVGFVVADTVLNLFPADGGTVYIGFNYNFNCSINTTNNSLKQIDFYSNYSSEGTFQKISTKYAGDYSNETKGGNFSVIYLGQNYTINPTRLEVDSGSVCTYAANAQDPCSLLVITNWLGGSSTYWLSTNSNADRWVKFDLDEKFYIESFGLVQNGAFWARNVKIESSLDNSTWQTLFNYTNATSSDTYTLSTPVKAKYIKATFGNSSAGTSIYINYLNISGKRYNYTGNYNISFDYFLNNQLTENGNYSWYCSYENDLGEITNSTYTTFNFSYLRSNLTIGSNATYSLDNESLLITCSASSEENLSSITLYTNQTGSYTVADNYFGNSTSGNSGDALLNHSAIYPNESLAEVIYVLNTSASGGETCLGDDYLTYQCPSATLVDYDWNGSNTQYWYAMNTLNSSNLVTYDLKNDYSLSRIRIETHSTLKFSKVNLSTSTDRENWTQVYSNDSIVSYITDVSLSSVRTRYVNLSIESLDTVVYVNKIQFYGQKYEINDTSANYSFVVPLNFSKNGTQEAFKCSVETLYGEKQTNSSINISIQTVPEIVNLTSYPENITAGNRLYFYCNLSDDEAVYPKSGLNSTVQYRTGSDSWVNASSNGFETPYIVETIGDSITASNNYQPALDSLMGSNTTSYNYGVGGDTCDEVYARYDANITNGTTVVIWCGINDITPAGNQTASTIGDMVNIQNLAESKNNTIVWLTVGTASNYPSVFDEILEINSWMENNFSQNYNLTLVNVYTALYNGTDAYCSEDPSYCNADGLHINSLGGQKVAETVWGEAFNYTKFNQNNYFYDVPSTTSRYYLDLRCKGDNGDVVSTWYTLSDYIYVSNDSLVATSSSTTTTTDTSDGSSGIGTYKPSKSVLENGYTTNVVSGQKVQVLFDGSYRDVEVKSVSEDKVVVTVNNQDYEISSSASGKIDLDSDGFYDVEITSNKIYSNGIASLEFKLINEEVPKEIQEEQQGNVEDNNSSEEKIGFWKKIGNFFAKIWDWISFWN